MDWIHENSLIEDKRNDKIHAESTHLSEPQKGIYHTGKFEVVEYNIVAAWCFVLLLAL